MASEIRVDKITSLSGVGTITPSSSGIDITGITTVATLKATTGIVTTLTATTGIVTTLTANTVTSLGAVSGTTGTFTGDVDIADKIVHTGDTNTAIRFPAADTITAETGGAEALRVTSSTAVIVAGTSAYSDGTFGEAKLQFNTKSGNHIGACSVADSNNSITHVLFKNPTGAIASVGTHNSDFIALTGNAERLRITSGGQVKVSGADDQDNFVVDAAQTQFVIHQDSSDGEVSIRAQDGSGNNYAKYMTFFVEGGSGPVERFRLDSSGNAKINDGDLVIGTSGHGISFSITANSSGSMSNELLDDYEEGTFTPYIDRENGSPIVGYDVQDGYYTKIGRVVYFYAEVRLNSYNGNGSYGLTHLRGLPYNAEARTGGRGVWNSVTYHSYYRDMTTTDGERDIAVVAGSDTKVTFYIQRSENSWATPPAPDSNDQFKIGGFYPV